MDGLVEDFLEYLRYERNYSPRTISPYKSSLEAFGLYWKSQDRSLGWESVTTDLIRDWIVALMDRGLTAAGVCPKLSAVKSFYRYLLRRGIVEVDPAHVVKAPKKDRSLPAFVSEGDMNILLDKVTYPDSYVGRRDRLILETLYSTGIRAAELLGLDIDDVDVGVGQLAVTGKRDKERIVPFGARLAGMMSEYLTERRDLSPAVGHENALLLNDVARCRLSYNALRDIVRLYLSQVTMMSKRTPHVLRHSFATSMLNNNADLQSVKELLGHEKLSTTAIYTHTTFRQLKQMYNQAHPRAGKNLADEDDAINKRR